MGEIYTVEVRTIRIRLEDTPLASTPAWRAAIETLGAPRGAKHPTVAEERRARLGMPYSVHKQSWPVYDEAMVAESLIEVVVQVNGKVRDRLMLPADASEADALAAPKIAEALAGAEPRKVIHVPGRLVNIVR